MVALFVVITFILFIVIDLLVLKAQGKKHPAFSAVKVFDSGFMYPGDIYLSTGHTWLKMLKEGLVRIGVDELVQKSLAGTNYQTVLAEGARVKKGEVLFSAVKGDKKLNFYAPVNGTVNKVNRLSDDNDPYKNWIISLRAENIDNDIKGMKFKETAVNWLAEEYTRLKDFLSFHTNDIAVAGSTIHDGGNIMEGVITNLNPNSIKEFENQFLKV